MSNDQYYGGQPYDPYANGNGNGQQSQQGADVTQTWEGQTWDTQYQPAVTYEQVQAARAQPPVSYGGQEAAYQQEQQPYPPYAPEQDSYGSHGSYGNGAPAAYYAEPQPHSAEAPAPEPAPAPVPAPAAEAGPAYSSPTTSGNTRITDAQRARAEGRSPIIDPGMRPAALTAVLGLLLAGGAALGSYGLLVPLVLLQGLTAAGWFRLNGMWPARQGIALAFAGGLAADAALLATGREHAAAAILGTLGVWVLLCLVLQLRSHADPDERMYGLMATVASAALTVIATGLLGADPDAVVVGGIAVAAAVLARALPLPGPVSLVGALLASAGAGIAAGGLTGLGPSGALLGLGAGVCALVGLRAAAYDYPSRFVHMTAGVALPLTAAAPAVYLLGRALV
ncbi:MULTISPECIES: hypothetical protein [Streptomyces]|uniref:Putative integral membrane protein n=3 Tax=Streptomyces venezuelae TaxID=54571 RepID=F2RFQ4_STRVP|nr:hypothetical protein [Streptomyces venezuelae]APE22945.1 hypothetical protein vnz_19365 [Streptomyces venezuelae]QES00325.1 hypothetical protein DEJ43_19630 [Streptomyces venezuelae ATCC 10712]CCA57206.1 putative integral membrane protein [Streptomyces venezuelae ATCC 10712]